MLVVELCLPWVGGRHDPKEYLLHVLNIDKMWQDVGFFEESNK